MAKSSFAEVIGKVSGKGPVIAGGFLILLILAAVYYSQKRSAAPEALMESLASHVSIGNPADGVELAAFEPVTIGTMAIGPTPFLSMELWIDGQLMSVQAGPSQGKTPLSTIFNWLPKEEGTFNLVARAIDANGQAFFSPGVSVMVTADENAGSLAGAFADVSAVSPALGGGGAGPAPSAPDPEDPAKPELVASVDAIGCSLDLLIHDLSDNEEGFNVYRNDTTSGPGYKKIATLPAQSSTDWITYEEDVWSIGYINANYYVVAFNSEGEAKSNIVHTFLDTIDCLVDPPEDAPSFDASLLTVQLQGLALLNMAPPERLYCYRSIDHGLWTRWPASDYFYPLPDGSFSIEEVLSAILLELDSGPNELSITLDLECWGWYGDDLQYLGSLHHDGQDLGFGASTIVGDGLQAILNFQQFDGLGPFYQLGGDFGTFTGAPEVIFKSLIDPQMQFVQAQVTYNPDICESHLPAEFQNLFGRILFCFPYPGFHGSFAEGDNPQPYLIWDFWNQCKDGYGIEPDGFCKSYQAYLDQAAANNGKVGFIVHDWSSAGYHRWIVDAPNLRMFNIPPNGCAGTRTFMVQMFYEEDGWTQYSPNGNEWPIECPKPVGNVVTLEFVFDSMTLSDMDDDDSGAQTVELFGYFQVQAPSSQLGSNNFLKMGAWDEQWSDCPDDTDYFTSNPPGSCTQRFTMGTYSLANVPLCKSSDYTESDRFHCYSHFGNSSTQDLYSTNNNRLRVEVQDGDAITLMVVLKDWDDASANETACWGFNDLGSKTIFEWDAMDGAGFSLFGFGDVENGGSCSISGTIHVLD